MGIASYNRGSAAVASQIAKPGQAAFERGARDNRIDALTARADRAESDLVKARRLIALLRAEKACHKQAISDERAAHDDTRGHLTRLWAALSRTRRAWFKASALLRLLPVSTVNALRAERDGAA